MIPLRLTLREFLCYAEETIDFAPLLEHGLFLITGDTGAGKSSIFNAILYALYGRQPASKTGAEVRRQGAKGRTEVELLFALEDARFIVRRSLTKSTEKTKASLHLIDGAGREELLAAKKRDVDARIEEMLGLGSEQFQQVMFLPQDEFARFLHADGPERAKLVSDIFGGAFYQRLQQHLADSVKERRAAVEDFVRRASEIGGRWGVDSPDALDGLAQQRRAEKDEASHRREALHANRKALDAELEKGMRRNRMMEQREQARLQFAEAEGAQPRRAEIDARLAAAEEAAKLLAPLRMLEGLEAEAKDIDARAGAMRKLAASLRDASERARMDKQESDTRATQLPELFASRRQLEDLRDMLPRLDELESGLHGLADKKYSLEKEEAELAARIGERARAIDAAQREADGIAQQLASQRTREGEWQARVDERRALEQRIADIRRLREIDRAIDETTARKKECEASLHALHERLRSADEMLNLDAAAKLARRLHDGEPCPVCGSPHHPRPAHTPASVPSVEEAETLRRSIDDARREHGKADGALAQLAAQRGELQQRLGDGKDDLATLEGALRQNQEQTAALAAAKDADAAGEARALQLRKETADAQKERERLESRRAATREELARATADAARIDGERVHLAERFEKASVGRDEVNDALEIAVTRIAAIEAEQRRTAAALADTQKALSENEGALSGLEARRTDVEKLAAQSAAEFEALRAATAFRTRDAVAHAMVDDAERNRLRAESRAIAERRVQAEATLAEREKALAEEFGADVAPFDATPIRAELARLDEALRALDGQIEEHAAALRQMQTDVSQWRATRKEEERARTEIGLAATVAALAGGQNERRLDLHAFVMQSYMGEIAEAANGFLRFMTSGRYELSSTAALDFRKKKAGPSLAVLDHWSGEERPVNSLSGGETFITALSLALGLAEVVRASSAKVRTRLLFIDEGFGSLDGDSLAEVMQTIERLRGAQRAVGIISHVQEMRELVPARLVVKKSPSGARVRFEEGATARER